MTSKTIHSFAGALITTALTATLFATTEANAQPSQANTSSTATKDSLSNIRFNTVSRFIIMPVTDRSGRSVIVDGKPVQVSDDYATEALNTAMRDAGASTISWFKVNAAMNKKLGQKGVERIDLTSDLFVPELLAVAKPLGARYIIRPTIINKSQNNTREVRMGFFAGTIINTKKTIVTLKVEIIGVPQEDTIAIQNFDGAVIEQTKRSELDGPAPVTTSSSPNQEYTAATNDAIVKATDFIASKAN